MRRSRLRLLVVLAAGVAPALLASSCHESDGGNISVSIAIDPASNLGTVQSGFVGLSYEKEHLRDGFFRGDNAPLVAMLDLLGPSILRVGANSVDTTVWQTLDGGALDGGVAPSITNDDVDNLAALAKSAGWKVLYGVNMETSNVAAAQAEATYAATSLGGALYGFEIGNEPDLYPAVSSSPGAWNYAAFRNDWALFANAIHAGAPGALLTGPATANHSSTWTAPFAADEGSAITLLTQHYYVANGQLDSSTIDFLLAPHPTLAPEIQALSAASADAGIANGVRMAECNSYYNGGAPGVSDGFGTALWAIDFLFENALSGSTGVNFHGGGNGPGYTPIADSAGNVIGARPIFYGMLLFAKAGTGTLRKVSGAPTSINFSAYAISGGASTSVVLSNKDRTNTVHAAIDVGFVATSASALRLEAPALESTSGVRLGGVAISADGSFAPTPEAVAATGSTITIDIPPASAALISVN